MHDAFERQVGLPAFVQLKRVGETNSVERSVSVGTCGEGIFDVDGGNVIRKQDNFVGVQFVQIFSLQVVGTNQARFNQARDESARARERVDDVNVAVGQASVEMFAQDGVDGAQDKIDDFDGRVHDTELFGGLFERDFEETAVQVIDDSLTACGVAHPAATFANLLVEAIENFAVFAHAVAVEHVENFLHGLRHGILFDEVVILKQSLKDGTRDEMLSQHVDGFVFVDGGIDVPAQTGKKFVEGAFVFTVNDKFFDSAGVAFDDFGNFVSPLNPVQTVADVFNHAGVNFGAEIFPAEEVKQRKLNGIRAGIFVGRFRRLNQNFFGG